MNRTVGGGLAVDFDGDGKGDLLGFDYGTSPASLLVWYGADLFPD